MEYLSLACASCFYSEKRHLRTRGALQTQAVPPTRKAHPLRHSFAAIVRAQQALFPWIPKMALPVNDDGDVAGW